MADNESRLMTVEEAAERLRVHPESVRRWLREGRIAGYRITRRAGWRIPTAEVERVLRGGMDDEGGQEGKAAA